MSCVLIVFPRTRVVSRLGRYREMVGCILGFKIKFKSTSYPRMLLSDIVLITPQHCLLCELLASCMKPVRPEAFGSEPEAEQQPNLIAGPLPNISRGIACSRPMASVISIHRPLDIVDVFKVWGEQINPIMAGEASGFHISQSGYSISV